MKTNEEVTKEQEVYKKTLRNLQRTTGKELLDKGFSISEISKILNISNKMCRNVILATFLEEMKHNK